ncbi:SDR family NAD(P)-dependent oxidoreductase [Jiangella alkaliphila]|uniref:NAD(P)-dependent dehydrogenase, short-chain alcohol dehydrogenase family n=1 Tax=Jiangella alkaliphila TaxID=419479 RepID=A0A1H2LJC0_9ACTN|nr:SDR family oxidoreductase [Jiangella alkaliphila]SDU80496.1 NAD(P)-dependent dehydrogenase, short-chain alcohol dehydrogenase family [Jiangella alkaliphila]
MSTIVIVGGTSGIGLELARRRVATGDDVVITGRDGSRCAAVAAEVGARCRGVAVELSDPDAIGAALSGVDRVDHLVVAAIDRDQNTAADYSVERALRLVTLKLVGYTEVVHALLPRMAPDGAVVLFGGLAKDRPYPGSTTVSTINGGVMGLVHTLAVELAPLRVNAVHPGIVGDSPFWQAKPAGVLDGYIARTPIGRLATMADVADSVDFLLRNPSMNGVNLNVDGGWLLT